MSTTRRLAAILAADVADYSAAMERDEEGTFAAVRALRREVIEPRLAEHQGRLIKTTGDGFLAEFASPIAAVKCAVAIQQRPVKGALKLRIGLNLGDVIIEDGGDVYGEGVNVAARLEGLAEPGGILVSDKIIREVEGKVDAAFEDRGEQQVKNITRPVRIYAVDFAGAPATVAASSIPEHGKPPPLPDKPSIAVLPFQNMSGDPEQDYFADGMVEDIITALSRFKSLFVIARNSSFTYKGKAVDIKQVGRELGVRYVLEGSVRQAGGRVRITGQLIDTASNKHLWADRFDGELENVFDLQDQITSKVAGVIAPQIQQSEIELAKRKTTDNLGSYDFFLRGMAASSDRMRWSAARDLFRNACAADPDFASAQVMFAYCMVLKQTVGMPLSADERTEAIQTAEQAYRLANDDSFVVARTAHVLAYLGRAYDRAETLAEEAVRLNPNDAAAWGISGWVSLICGEPARAIEGFERRLHLSPIDPGKHSIWNGMSFACFFLHDFDRGRSFALKALEAGLETHTLCALILNDVGADRLEEAQAIASRLLGFNRDFRASQVRQLFPVRHSRMHEQMVLALCRAGLLE